MRHKQSRADKLAEIESAQFIIGMRNAATPNQLNHAIAILDKHIDYMTSHYRAYYQHLRRLELCRD